MSAKKIVAHINGKTGDEHLLEHHLMDVGARSSAMANSARPNDSDFSDLSQAIGELHDLGKTSDYFQQRIWENVTGSSTNASGFPGPKNKNHTAAGAYLAALNPKGKSRSNLDAAVANIIAAHHIGLGDSTTLSPLGKSVADHMSDQAFADPASRKAVIMWAKANVNNGQALPKVMNHKELTDMEVRMLESILADADRLDAEAFFCGVKKYSNYDPVKCGVPPWRMGGESLSILLNKLRIYMAANFHVPPSRAQYQSVGVSSLNIDRSMLYYDCSEAGSQKPVGVYRLSALTGFGKTLASIAFALEHAVAHGLDRVIYCLPYTAIIDQVSDIFRTIFGSENVLEHHSSNTRDNLPNPTTRVHHLKAEENWQMSIVVTTNVQFFESMFSNHPSSLRKMHSAARSVVIVDEAQAVPYEWAKTCFDGLARLNKEFGATILYCTATQPCLPMLYDSPEINTSFARHWQNYNRVTTTYEPDKQYQIKDLVAEINVKGQSALAIFNTRDSTVAAYREAKAHGVPGEVVCLTTYLTRIDRMEKIKQVRDALKRGERVTVFSTSLIEAGVDVDFPVAYREIAGLDSIVQSAGRCNRNGNMKTGDFVVFKLDSLSKGIATLVNCLPHGFDSNLIDPKNYDAYYSAVVRNRTNKYEAAAKYLKDFKFKAMADHFKMIQDTQVRVYIECAPGAKQALDAAKKDDSKVYDYRRLNNYCASDYISDKQIKTHAQSGKLSDHLLVDFGFYVLTDAAAYSSDIGLDL